MEGIIFGFDEYTNFVDEVLIKKETRKAVGRILLKGLIHVKEKSVTKEDPLHLHEIILSVPSSDLYYECFIS